MMRCWWYILWISEFYRFEARFIITESCSTAKSLTVIPERCILECVQLLYDNKFCSFCEIDAASSTIDFVEYNKALVDKRMLKWCTACENGQLQINSDHKELRRQVENFFNALEASWCNDALKLNEFKDEKELNRKKRYNPGIGGSHYHSSTNSSNSSQASMMVGMIISGIILLCALVYLCKMFAKRLDPQQSYEINS